MFVHESEHLDLADLSSVPIPTADQGTNHLRPEQRSACCIKACRMLVVCKRSSQSSNSLIGIFSLRYPRFRCRPSHRCLPLNTMVCMRLCERRLHMDLQRHALAMPASCDPDVHGPGSMDNPFQVFEEAALAQASEVSGTPLNALTMKTAVMINF